MANRNNFKLLHAKCIQIYENVLATLKINKDSLCNLTDTEKARYGFYYLILQTLTDGNEIEEFTDMIWNSLNEENKVSLFVRYIIYYSYEVFFYFFVWYFEVVFFTKCTFFFSIKCYISCY